MINELIHSVQNNKKERSAEHFGGSLYFMRLLHLGEAAHFYIKLALM